MSVVAPSHAESHPAVAHGDAGRGHDEGHGHGTRKSYVTGFVLSVILTAIPFWLVMGNVLKNSVETSLAIMALAAVQILVHMIYFLHMNTKSEGGWTMMAMLFTLTLVIITLTGSIWVMYHLNQNMMPMSGGDITHRH